MDDSISIARQLHTANLFYLTPRLLVGVFDLEIAQAYDLLQQLTARGLVMGVEKVRQLNQMAEQRGQSMAQMAIAWTLRHSVMTSALIGASRVGQIEEAVAALDNLAFSEEELAKIEGILA